MVGAAGTAIVPLASGPGQDMENGGAGSPGMLSTKAIFFPSKERTGEVQDLAGRRW